MAKPPKDPTTPPSKTTAKPAARRAPRNAAAKSATRRAAAPPKPAVSTVAAEAPKAAVAPAPARKPRATKPRATPAQRPAPSRPQAATAAAKAAIAKVPTTAKAALDAVPGRAWTIGAVVAAAGAGLAAFLTRGRIAKLLSREGHEPVDLLYPDRDGPVKHSDDRAPEAFRPDMDAAMSPAEREALRPPTKPLD